jgi:ADP-ribose diphosphatase
MTTKATGCGFIANRSLARHLAATSNYNPGMSKPPEILATRPARDSRFLRIEEVDLAFSNGAHRTFERLSASGRGAVFIVPMQDRDTVLLVREYCVGVDRYELGLVKGRIDPGETPLQAADRELQEEAGFGARKLTPLATLSLSPAYMTHKAQVILAEDLYPQRRPGDEPETLEVVPWNASRMKVARWPAARVRRSWKSTREASRSKPRATIRR